MKVNSHKFNIMTFSFPKSKTSFATPIPNEIIKTKTKLLRVTLTVSVSPSLSLLKLFAKFSCPKAHILLFYISFIRPQLEYACLVWNFGLTVDLSDWLEIIQKRALRIIYGQGKVIYILLLKEFCLPTLANQRVTLCTNFWNNLRRNQRFQCILPARHCPPKPRLPRLKAQRIPIRNPISASTERYRKSFVPAFVETIKKKKKIAINHANVSCVLLIC